MSIDPTVLSGERRATIRDVAKLAGVSTAAVSRVLRNAYGVSDKMVVLVRKAMEDLDYRPHAAARGMRGKTFTIGIVHPDMRNTFFPDIISALAEPVLQTGREMFFATSAFTSTESVLEAMHDRQIEGVVLIAPTIGEKKLVNIAKKMPIVLTHRHSASNHYDTLVSEDEAGGEMVVEHLVGLGHKRIYHLGPAVGRLAMQMSFVPARRAKGYLRGMEKAGLKQFARVVHTPSYTFQSGYDAAMELFRSGDIPTAIFAGADNVAFGVMHAAYEIGISIPERLSLVGYDNTKTSMIGPISLTSVDQDPGQIGLRAGELLLSRINGRKEPVRMSFPPSLIARRSSGPPSS